MKKELMKKKYVDVLCYKTLVRQKIGLTSSI